jgi:hypothetical protein
MIKIMKLESLDEEKSLFDISPTSNKWMKGKLRVGYNQSQKSGMPKEMFKKGQVIDLHPFDGDRFVGAKSPKDKGSYFFVAKRHVDAMNESVQLDEATQHIVHVNVSRTGFRKLEAMIASLNGYRESDYSDGKARFYFDEKHDSSERKKVAEFINKTRGAEFSHAMKENVQLDEEVIKARVAFFGRPSKNNSDMRDAKKKNMFVDAKDVDAAKGKMFDVTFNSRRQFNRFESEYDFLMVKVFEDVQLDEERVPTYVIDRQSKKIVHGPTDTADAKLYMKKQIQPRKFMIRQIRGEAKKVGDTV